ncbi:MAG TPA: HAD family hydrolase [Caproiciproducens sp.]|nr:HAD family hydrolase [Caproiciproducens sp.]
MSEKLIVFDLDGTLNQTENYVVPAMRLALYQLGVKKFSEQDILDTIGARDEDTIVKFFGDKAPEYEEKFFKKVDRYVEDNLHLYRPYYGVEKMLQTLRERGYSLAICSNASRNYITKTIHRLQIESYFDYLQELVAGMTKADTLGLLLNRVKPEAALMVGDRYFDRDAAAVNHIPFVGCSFGYGKFQELEGADYLIRSPMELLKIAK